MTHSIWNFVLCAQLPTQDQPRKPRCQPGRTLSPGPLSLTTPVTRHPRRSGNQPLRAPGGPPWQAGALHPAHAWRPRWPPVECQAQRGRVTCPGPQSQDAARSQHPGATRAGVSLRKRSREQRRGGPGASAAARAQGPVARRPGPLRRSCRPLGDPAAPLLGPAPA